MDDLRVNIIVIRTRKDMKNATLLLVTLILIFQRNAQAEQENYAGIQFASLISNWPGLHLNYERKVSENIGALLSIAGYKWDSEMSLRNESASSIYGFSIKSELRRYFSRNYILLPIAFTSFDENLSRGGYKYESIGFGVGKKLIGKLIFVDLNIQVLFTNKNPVRDMEENPSTNEGEGHTVGLEILPEKFSWLLNSSYPNMNLDANILIGYAW